MVEMSKPLFNTDNIERYIVNVDVVVWDTKPLFNMESLRLKPSYCY